MLISIGLAFPASIGTSETVEAVFESSASVIIKRGLEKSVTQNITIDENLEAPIVKSQKIGTATYTLNDEVIATVNLVANADVKKSGFMNVTTDVYSQWFNMMR